MLTIAEYVKPKSCAEAYNLLTTAENAALVGGGFFLRLAARQIGTAIDLSQAGLDFIRETDRNIEIGAMTTLTQLMKSEALARQWDGLIPATVANLPGTQIRNMVSVGGTVYGRYGFSELLTSLLVLNCRVALHHGGEMSLAEFVAQGKIVDVVEKVALEKIPLRASYTAFRHAAGSLPILTVAVSRAADNCDAPYRIAVGGRPGVATHAAEAMAYLNEIPVDAAACQKAGEIAAAELSFGNDRRASGEYRRELCKTLVKRALWEVQ